MQNLQVISKSEKLNTILFVALAPDEIDRNWDVISEIEITKTAHEFMENLSEKNVDIDHNNLNQVENIKFVESFVAPVPILLENGNIIPKWAWVVWIKFEEEIYNKFLSWDFVWISIEWVWKYEKNIL